MAEKNLSGCSTRNFIATVFESIESRRHRSVSYYTGSSEMSTTASYFGAILIGDNGDPGGVPTMMLGQNSSIADATYRVWDTDLDDGVDSSTIQAVFSFNTDSASNATWLIDTDSAGTFSLPSASSVHSVELRAWVAGPGLGFAWSDITINFYSGGSVVESISANSFSADTRNASNWDPAVAGTVVTPTVTNVSGVQVVAKFRLQADAGTYPGAADMFGQVFIS